MSEDQVKLIDHNIIKDPSMKSLNPDASTNLIQEIDFSDKWTLSISPKSKNSFEPYKINSEEASAPQLEFVYNYAKLDLDNLMDKKIGPSGYHMKLLLLQSCFSMSMAG